MHNCACCNRIFQSEEDYMRFGSSWIICDRGDLWFNCNCGSTLVLKKGKYPWFSHGLFMSKEAQSIFNRLGVEKIPYIPNSIMQLKLLIEKDASFDELAHAFKKAPILASEIIAIAESIKNSRDSDGLKIKSINHALVYIGKKALSHFILLASIRHFVIPEHIIDIKKFWQKAFLTGNIGEKILSLTSLPLAADEVYLSCVLLNIGKLVSSICFPEQTEKLCNYISQSDKIVTWGQAEPFFDLPSHTVLGEIAASVWGLPSFVRDSIRLHHKPLLDKSLEHYDNISAFAHLLSYGIKLEPQLVDKNMFTQLQKLFAIDSVTLYDLMEKIDSQR